MKLASGLGGSTRLLAARRSNGAGRRARSTAVVAEARRNELAERLPGEPCSQWREGGMGAGCQPGALYFICCCCCGIRAAPWLSLHPFAHLYDGTAAMWQRGAPASDAGASPAWSCASSGSPPPPPPPNHHTHTHTHTSHCHWPPPHIEGWVCLAVLASNLWPHPPSTLWLRPLLPQRQNPSQHQPASQPPRFPPPFSPFARLPACSGGGWPVPCQHRRRCPGCRRRPG